MNLANTLNSVLLLVRRASALMAVSDFDIEQKDGCENIVTSSDIAVQNFLVAELSALLPGCGFVCEEEGMNDASREYVWVIDPIDGTANYARGWGSCAISVGLMRRKGRKDGPNDCPEVLLGVVFIPSRDEMYWASKGQGAFCNGKPIHCSARSFEDSMLCCALSTYRKDLAPACGEVVMDAFHQCNDVRRFGSAAVELCFLAAGYCELYFEIRLQPWDYAAGIAIVREAGGIVTNLDSKQPSLEAPDLVCCGNNSSNHARLLEIVRRHIPSLPY